MNCSQVGDVSIHISSILPVFVSDVNEAPFNLTLSNTAVEENMESTPSFVATISAKDPDHNVSITIYSYCVHIHSLTE